LTKELLERLHSYTCAADAIEALQARVADQSAQLTRHTNLIDQLQEERCKLAAELAEIHKQEPVSHRYRFIHPISGEPVWRDSSPMWNGQCVQEVQPLFAAPVPPVREPLSYRDILRIYNEVGPEDGVPYRFAGAIEAAINRKQDKEWRATL
jgi:hypothetical protein